MITLTAEQRRTRSHRPQTDQRHCGCGRARGDRSKLVDANFVMGNPLRIVNVQSLARREPRGPMTVRLRIGRCLSGNRMVRDDLFLLAVKRGDLHTVVVEHPQPQRGRRVVAPAAVAAR